MTSRVALLGKPLKRRHSQVMHDAAFARAGIDAHYELLELEPDAVEALSEGADRETGRSRPRRTSRQESGVETGAPGAGRTEYGAARVCPRRFCR